MNAASSKATIQSRSLARALQALQRTGVDGNRVLSGCGLSGSMLDDPDARVPFERFAAFYEAAATASGRDDFGLSVGADTHLGAFDVLGYAALSCATVADAIATLARYFRVLEDGAAIELTVDGPQAALAYRVLPDIDGTHQIVELGVTVLLRWMQSLLGAQWRPLEVRFRHAAAGSTAPYAEVFQAPVRFSSAADEIRFEAACLERAVDSADPALNRIMQRQLASMFSALPAVDDWLAALRGAVSNAVHGGRVSLPEVAAALGMSPRTLQRRLARQDLTFRGAVDEVREALARHYLEQPGIGIGQVAYRLGYGEISAFHRAFKRWTGLTPDAHRRSRLQRSAAPRTTGAKCQANGAE